MYPQSLPPFVYLHKNYTYRLKLGFYAAPSNAKLFSKTVKNELDKLKYSYNSDLKALVMGFGQISSNQVIPADFRHSINVSVNVDVYIFRPPVGSIIEAVVNQVSESHVGCLVLELFNISIVRPENKPYSCWQGSKVKKDDKINVRILSFDTTKKLPHITGEIVSNSDNVLSDSGAASQSEADNLSTKASSKVASESDTERETEVIMKTSCPNSSSSSPLHSSYTQNFSGSEHSVNSLSATRHKRFEQMQKHLEKKKTASRLQSQVFIKPNEQEDNQTKFVLATKNSTKMTKSPNKATKSPINDSFKPTNTSLNFSINNDLLKRESSDSKKKKIHQDSASSINSSLAFTKLNQSATKITDNSSTSSSDEENKLLIKSLVNKSLTESRIIRESMNKTPRNSTAPHVDGAEKRNVTSAEPLDSSSSDEHETVKRTSRENIQTKTINDSNGNDSSDDEMFKSLKVNQVKKEKNEILCKPVQSNKTINVDSAEKENLNSAESSDSPSNDEHEAVKRTSRENIQSKTTGDSNSSDSSDDEMLKSLKMNQVKEEKNKTFCKPLETNIVLKKKIHQDSLNTTNSSSALTKLNQSGIKINDSSSSSSSDEENESLMTLLVNKSLSKSQTNRESINKSPKNISTVHSTSKKKYQMKTTGDSNSSNSTGDDMFKMLKMNQSKKEKNETSIQTNKVTFQDQTSSSEDEEESPMKRQPDKSSHQSPISKKTVNKKGSKDITASPSTASKIKSKKNHSTLSDAAKDKSSSDEGEMEFFKSILSTSTPRYVDNVKKDNNISNVTCDSSSSDEDDTPTSNKNNTVKTTKTSQGHAKDQSNAKCNLNKKVSNSSSESSDDDMYKSLKMIIAKNPRESLCDSKKVVTINNVTFRDTSSSSADEKELKLQNDKKLPQSRKIDDKLKSSKSLLHNIKHDSSFSPKVVDFKDEDNNCTNGNNNLLSTEPSDKNKNKNPKIESVSSPKLSNLSASLKKSDTEAKHLLNQKMSGCSSERSGDEMFKSIKMNTNKKENDIVSNSKRTVTINNVMFQGTSSSEDDNDPNSRDINCLNGKSNKVPINTIKNPIENVRSVFATNHLLDEQDVVDGKKKKKKSKKNTNCEVSESPLIKNVKCSPKSPTLKLSCTKNSQAETNNRLTLKENDSSSEDDLIKSVNEILKNGSTYKLTKDGEKMKKNSKIPSDPTRSDEDTTQTGKLKRLSNLTSVLPKTNSHLNDKNSEDETCKSKKKKKTKIKEHKNLKKTGATFHNISSSEDENMLLMKSFMSKSVTANPIINVPLRKTVKISSEENKCTDSNGGSSKMQTTDTAKRKKKKKKEIQNVTLDSPSIKTKQTDILKTIPGKNTKIDNASIDEMSSSEDEIELLTRSLISKLSRKSPTKVAAKKVNKSTNDEVLKSKKIDVSQEDVENTSMLVSATTVNTKKTKKKKRKENNNVVMVESPSTSKNKTKHDEIIKKLIKEQCDSSCSEDENKLIMKSLHSKSLTKNALANDSVKTVHKPLGENNFKNKNSNLSKANETLNSNKKLKIKKSSNTLESPVAKIEFDYNSSLTSKQKPSKKSTQAEIIKKLCQDTNDSSSEEDKCNLINKILNKTSKRVKDRKKKKRVSQVLSNLTSDDKSLSNSNTTKAVPSNTTKVLTKMKHSSANCSEDDKTHISLKQSSTVKEKRKSQKFKFINLTSHQDSSSSDDEHELLIKSIMLNKSLPTSLKTKIPPGESEANNRNINKKSKIKTGSPLSLKGTPSNTSEKSLAPKLSSSKKHHQAELMDQITQSEIYSNSRKRPNPNRDTEEIIKKKKKKKCNISY